MGLAILAGIAAALGHAPFGFWPLALLGFSGLIYLVTGTDRPARIAWAGGVGYFGLALHWIVEPFLVDVARHGWMAPFALVFLASGLALFWGAAGWLSKHVAGNRAVSFALTLGLAELARGYVLTGFPWALPAYIWTDTPVRLVASLIGPYGLTLVTLVLLAILVSDAHAPKGRLATMVSLGLFGALFLTSLALRGPVETTGQVVRLVQPNAPQDEKWDPDKAYGFVERQINFTAEAAERRPDLIVWPESAVPYRLDNASSILANITEAADGADVVLGINRRNRGKSYNAMIRLSDALLPAEMYDKVHLVPFGEYIPLGQLAQLVGLQSFAAKDGYGFSPGESVALMDTGVGRALPMICYETIFPQHVRRAEGRADYMLQITNDAWFGTFSGPFQHLQQAQFRAAEQGLPLIRAANTGISAVIGPDGRVIQSLGLGETGFLDVELPESWGPTLYTRTGDRLVTVILLVTLSALFLLNLRNTLAMQRRST